MAIALIGMRIPYPQLHNSLKGGSLRPWGMDELTPPAATRSMQTMLLVDPYPPRGEGRAGRMTLEMDNSTAHTLAAEIRDLEIEPYGAP